MSVVVLVYEAGIGGEVNIWDGVCVGPFRSWSAAENWVKLNPEVNSYIFSLRPQSQDDPIIENFKTYKP
jgi:hypothetical protein